MFVDSTKEKIFLVRHLYLMVKGGFLVSEAIESIKEEVKSRALRKALEDILKRILAGESLHKSISRHPNVFSPFYQSIIRIGEESGSLENNLNYLAGQIQSDYDTRRKIKGAMLYPLIVIVLAVTIALAVTIFILPKILNIFEVLDIKLPFTTIILITSVHFLQKNWLFLLVGMLLLVITVKLLRKILFFRYYFDRFLLSFPVSGQITKNMNLSRFAQSFYTLLKSGVPILESIDIISRTITNEVFKKDLVALRLEVEKGGRVSQGLKSSRKTFPSIFTQMVAVGERSGSLENSLRYLAKFYQKEVNASLKTLTGVLEPILLVCVGLFVAFIALSIITPIYQFSGSLRLR